MVRDPRAVIAGSLRAFKRYKNIPFNFPFDINLSITLSAQEFCQKMTKRGELEEILMINLSKKKFQECHIKLSKQTIMMLG